MLELAPWLRNYRLSGSMRNFRAKVNDRQYSVSVEETGSGRCRVSLDGAMFDIELANKSDVLTWTVRSDGTPRRAQTRALPNDLVEACLAGLPFTVSVQAVGSVAQAPPVDKGAENRHGGQIRALMPGRVTSILVKVDDHVEVGSPLLILEAMKMQNEISSPIAGRVKSIQTSDGRTVSKDAILMEIS